MKDKVSEPKLSAWTTDHVKPSKIPLAHPLKMQFPVPAPKILNWTTEPLEIEHSKCSPVLISAQPVKFQEPEPPKITPSSSVEVETLKKILQDSGAHGHPTAPTEKTIGRRSEDQAWLPATDGGDFPKPAKKTRKEPSSRRFAKPTNPALIPDTIPSDEPQKIMDPKTRKKRLRKFLKLARKLKPKNNPANAD
ncbi:uncharacterized protein LOC115929448 [Strongylocentrotus purpuratus]|uniref:Uncharacterized protein n=1 Tax=Strongylocentrotus purpuratus TaxID=7668 RepID=A0A7M7PQY4_STRPU|nr:uncharacterized protein LOC115929448 [Strongylocentrotus purpuratus]